MGASAGHLGQVKIGDLDESTAYSNEATTKTVANTVYQITDSTKRVADPLVTPTIEVDATGGGSWAPAVGATLNPFTGEVTFDSDQGASALVRVSGASVPVEVMANVREASISGGLAQSDSSVMGVGGRQRTSTLHDAEVTLQLFDDILTDYVSGGGSFTWYEIATSKKPVFLDVNLAPTGMKLRGWFNLQDASPTATVDELLEAGITCVGAGQGDSPNDVLWEWVAQAT